MLVWIMRELLGGGFLIWSLEPCPQASVHIVLRTVASEMCDGLTVWTVRAQPQERGAGKRGGIGGRTAGRLVCVRNKASRGGLG